MYHNNYYVCIHNAITLLLPTIGTLLYLCDKSAIEALIQKNDKISCSNIRLQISENILMTPSLSANSSHASQSMHGQLLKNKVLYQLCNYEGGGSSTRFTISYPTTVQGLGLSSVLTHHHQHEYGTM